MPYVYMLMCRDGTYYTGAAKLLAARLRQHEQGRASRYTRARLPVRLVWSRRVRTWSAALRQEYRLKQLQRAEKEALVAAAAAGRVAAGKAAPPAAARSATRKRGGRVLA